MDRVRNEKMQRRIGIERELANGAEQRMLQRFGDVKKMRDMRLRGKPLMG